MLSEKLCLSQLKLRVVPSEERSRQNIRGPSLSSCVFPRRETLEIGEEQRFGNLTEQLGSQLWC